MDNGTRARVEEEKAPDTCRLRSSARLGFVGSSSSTGTSSRIARRKRKKGRRQNRRSSDLEEPRGRRGEDDKEGDKDQGKEDPEEEEEEEEDLVLVDLEILATRQVDASTSSGVVDSVRRERNHHHRLDSQRRNLEGVVPAPLSSSSSIESGSGLVNRRISIQRAPRRCNAGARRTTSTMDLERLISEVHARPAIWDQKNVNYHNRDVILKMWREIARACEVSTDVAKSKWKHLRDNFRNELKKTCRGKCEGTAAGNELDSKWVWFKSLFFLWDQMNSKVIGCALSQNCSTGLRSSPEGTQIEPQIDILEGHEETRFSVAEVDGDSYQSLLSNEEHSQQMPPPKLNKMRRKRTLVDAIDADYTELDRKRLEVLQKRIPVLQTEEDDTYHFLMSVRNPLKSLPLDRQMFLRLKIQELVYNEINSQNHQNRAYEITQDVKPPRTSGLNSIAPGQPGAGVLNDSNDATNSMQNSTTDAPNGDAFFG